VLAVARLREEGREAVVVGRGRALHEAAIGLRVSQSAPSSHVATYAQTVLDGVELPAGVTDLDTCPSARVSLACPIVVRVDAPA
jgi:hypothetical protein